MNIPGPEVIKVFPEVIKVFPEVIKVFSYSFDSVEHEILSAHKYKNIKKLGFFKAQMSLECYFSRS